MRTAPTALDAPTGLHPRTAYFGALLLATLLPLLSLPLMAAAELPFDSSLLLGIAIFAGGAGHVASTACIYADPRVRATVAPMKGRFYALPIAVIALSVLAYVGARSFDVDDGAVAGIFLFHLLWLYYHYQKQNYGLVAFSAAGAGRRVPRVLAPVLLLPALAGSAATLPALLADGLPYATFLEPYAALLRRGGLVLYGLGACALVVLIARHRQSFADLRTVIFTATAFLSQWACSASHDWNISTSQRWACQLRLPARCSLHFFRIGPWFRYPSLFNRFSSSRSSAHSLSGPRSHELSGTPKPIFGRSMSCCGINLFNTSLTIHFPAPFRTL